MTSRIRNFSFNSPDPYALAQFWSKVTGRPLHEDDKPGEPEASVELGDGTSLFFQVDPKPKTTRNRLHVCLQPDIPRDAEVDRLIGIGATLFEDHRQPDGTGWAVMRDPEGNEFCVERSVAERAATS